MQSRVSWIVREALEGAMFVPGEEMERMDFVTLAVDIMDRWSSRDQDGMAGMPVGGELICWVGFCGIRCSVCIRGTWSCCIVRMKFRR